jgi:Major Facilitator Superfamily
VFPLAVTPYEVLGARVADRIGKGIRGAPRDSMVADVTPQEIRGAAYGLRQALDTVGAFVGPLLAIALMYLLADDMRSIFLWAAARAAIAVLLIVFVVEEPKHLHANDGPKVPITWTDIGKFSSAYWSVVAVGVLFTMARFSDAFLLLRAQDVGLALALVPLVLVVMNVVYATVSTPAGRWSDRIDGRIVIGVLTPKSTADAKARPGAIDRRFADGRSVIRDYTSAVPIINPPLHSRGGTGGRAQAARAVLGSSRKRSRR